MRWHARCGFSESTAEAEYVPYIVPQEHGNHIGTRLLEMKDGLRFYADTPFECNVSRYSAMQLVNAMHVNELELEDVIIRIDYKDSGIGSHSCGPEMLEQYKFNEKHIDKFAFRVKV